MKELHNTPKIADQSKSGVAKTKKHDVNLRKNSTIYFQIGLILCLLGVYGLFEMQFQTKIYRYSDRIPIDDELFIENVTYVLEKKAVAVPVKKNVALRGQKLKVVPDVKPIIEFPATPPPIIVAPTLPTILPKIKHAKTHDDTNKNYTVMGVESVPIYPGCEKAKGNLERRACMSVKLSRLIQRKFNTAIAERTGLTGLQKIQVQFRIDKSGLVTDIKTRAPNELLEEEAAKVMRAVPTMIPGKQSNKPVSVLYSLPIVFKIQD